MASSKALRVRGEAVRISAEVWRSVRKKGDTKNEKSRRTIALPSHVVAILLDYSVKQVESHKRNGHEHEGVVYIVGTRHDTVKDARIVRRFVQAIVREAEIEGAWVPRELRHTFVSGMSIQGAREQLIADLVGHKKTSTTRTVYRHQLRPVITAGANLLDVVFEEEFGEAE
ncbi:tyrosine-type recombinase/integrase [Glycomyces luteolus]|uniref:Tyrosine-type recombinase/integrase n=1 Tax=Glycomyces luteolus TaxID=2670330 RepID=A0A9X3PD95_9ACTN|nr:tyrosine-type recombinase/integrase [Glycomyces luteolus]MDA1360469.1 tyrosine-type recombinase/integrase [Glycomyces luteolus]